MKTILTIPPWNSTENISPTFNYYDSIGFWLPNSHAIDRYLADNNIHTLYLIAFNRTEHTHNPVNKVKIY